MILSLSTESCNDEVVENRSLKQRLAARISPQLGQLPLDSTEAREHFWHSGGPLRLMEDVAQTDHDSLWPSVVDLGVNAIDIAR